MKRRIDAVVRSLHLDITAVDLDLKAFHPFITLQYINITAVNRQLLIRMDPVVSRKDRKYTVFYRHILIAVYRIIARIQRIFAACYDQIYIRFHRLGTFRIFL